METGEFIAAEPKPDGPYYQRVHDLLLEHGINGFSDLTSFNNLDTKDQINLCKEFLSLACETQNIANIMIGRYCLQNISVDWAARNLDAIAKEYLNLTDDWEYLRLLEVYSSIDLRLRYKLAEWGLDSPNEEIRRLAYEWKC
jgi:hypothetical protein